MNKQMPIVSSFVLFLLLCASATYWVLQLMKPPQRPVAAATSSAVNQVPLEAAAGLFGGSTVKVAIATNFQLKGVVAAGSANESIAIVVANGKPQQSVRVNAEIEPGVLVKEVHGQYMLLSERGVTRRVDLQDLAKNPMQSSLPSNSQVAGSIAVPPQRSETPPPPAPMPTQMAPAMPTTMIMPSQAPSAQTQPPPAPGQQYGGAVAMPPGATEPSGPQRSHTGH